ncbi:hypothetical protein [Nostocoides australiense]|nr:hypothetical protein [Tetrasphaera australiensis]HRW00510.1 hypothetical protein [Tetrasphaera sp.]
MVKKALATLAAATLVLSASACDDGAGPTGRATTPATMASGTMGVVPPVLMETGKVDLGIKWNWNLKPPLAYAQQVGWGETFFEVEWCALRDRPEGTRFAQVERILGQAQALGYRLMLKIRVGNCGGGNKELDPAEGTRKSPSTFPDDPAAYQQFVTTMVKLYSGRGVKSWAIENEVDANNFWSGTPEEYTRLVTMASEAIKAGDPDATILDAGISSTGNGIELAGELMDAGKEQEALALYQQWFGRRNEGPQARFGMVDSVDALRSLLSDGRAKRIRAMVAANWAAINSGAVTSYQLHFYENPDLLPDLLDYIRRHLTVRIPIGGWEIGTAWPGDNYTEQIHGAETARLLGALMREQVSPIVYLPLAYTPGGATKVEIFRGLVTPEGASTPAGEVYAAYAKYAKDSTDVAGVRTSGGTGILLVAPSGSLLVLWPDGEGSLRITGAGARSAADPAGSVPAGSTPRDPVLIELAATDREGALKAGEAVVGSPVTAG